MISAQIYDISMIIPYIFSIYDIKHHKKTHNSIVFYSSYLKETDIYGTTHRHLLITISVSKTSFSETNGHLWDYSQTFTDYYICVQNFFF